MNHVSVSTLPMNLDNLEIDIERVSTADSFHVDIMDGKFVEATTFWADDVKVLRSKTDKELNVHLMIVEPEKFVDEFADAGADIINFQIEATEVPEKVISKIKAKGVRVGITISPNTPLEKLKPFLDEIDRVMVMTVVPGKGGQGFIDMTDRIKELRKLKPEMDIEADGGVNAETAPRVVAAGANVLCSGSYVFKHPSPKEAIDILRNS